MKRRTGKQGGRGRGGGAVGSVSHEGCKSIN
jgi:hypothetical protein